MLNEKEEAHRKKWRDLENKIIEWTNEKNELSAVKKRGTQPTKEREEEMMILLLLSVYTHTHTDREKEPHG